MISTIEIETAYRKLKRQVYYDKTDLQLRLRLAQFETSPDFDEKLRGIHRILNQVEPTTDLNFRRFLTEISVRIVPKNVVGKGFAQEKRGTFLTNVNPDRKYRVDKVNYFIDAPIELHLIAVLWIMKQGWMLDSGLSKCCVGNRLEQAVGGKNDTSSLLFRPYHKLYSKWRDGGIRVAREEISQNKNNIYILGLDLKEYFYRINFNSEAIQTYVQENWSESRFPLKSSPITADANLLLQCLQQIYKTFGTQCAAFLRQTHPSIEITSGIAIGLCASPLIGNWYLRDFDEQLSHQIRPVYYGRYVDDIMMVVRARSAPSIKDPVNEFMRANFVEQGLMHELEGDSYSLIRPVGLQLQQKKCILQYFDKKYSTAVLEKFQKKLEANASDFLLLPVEDDDAVIDDVSYDLLYEGSINKFRSVKGVVENRYELGKQLDKQTTLSLITGSHLAKDNQRKLLQFFKGRSSIEFYGMWERVFTFFIVSQDSQGAARFFKKMSVAIERTHKILSTDNDKTENTGTKKARYSYQSQITKALQESLTKHLSLSYSMALALAVNEEDVANDTVEAHNQVFRKSNLIRYQYVRTPLINYTTFSGSYLSGSVGVKLKIDNHKLHYSPRYVYLYELVVMANSGLLETGSDLLEWAKNQYFLINGKDAEDIYITEINQTLD